MSTHDEDGLSKLVDDEISNNCKAYDQIDSKVAHKFALLGYRAAQASRENSKEFLAANSSVYHELMKENDQLTTKLEKLYREQSRQADLAINRLESLAIEKLKNQKLVEENERLKEALSYLPKVPTQPYEKELAQQLSVEKLKSQKLADVVKRCMPCHCGPTTRCSRCEALTEYNANNER